MSFQMSTQQPSGVLEDRRHATGSALRIGSIAPGLAWSVAHPGIMSTVIRAWDPGCAAMKEKAGEVDGGSATPPVSDAVLAPAATGWWPAGRRAFSGLRTACCRRPLLTVALIASLGAAQSAWVIWNTRTLGTFDPDELGYLASALRLDRNVSIGRPWVYVATLREISLGPLVPALSTPFLILGPRDPRTAMLVQPFLAVLAAVASAGIARRFVSPGWTILTGAYVAALPTVVLASQAYWLGLGAAAFMAAAVWFLLCSERLSSTPWSVACGVAVGFMLLSRTMTLGFAPGVVLAGLLLAWGSRRALVNLSLLCLAAFVVAAPWYWYQRQQVFGYLFSYGFGDEAAEWGSGGVPQRVVHRISQLVDASLAPTSWWAAVVAIGAVVAGVVGWIRSRRSSGDRSPSREAGAVVVVLVVGIAALVSTTNEGVWFELPLVVLAVPVLVAVVGCGPRAIRLAVVAGMAAVAVVSPVWHAADGGRHSDQAFAASDPRFISDREAERTRAAQQWWSLAEVTTARLDELTDRGESGVIAVTGNTFLFNSNSVIFAAELQGWDAAVHVAETYGAEPVRAQDLAPLSGALGPSGKALERVLVVARHDLPLFTPDFGWRALEQAALADGWSEVWSAPMPIDGEVAILRHRSQLGSGGDP